MLKKSLALLILIQATSAMAVDFDVPVNDPIMVTIMQIKENGGYIDAYDAAGNKRISEYGGFQYSYFTRSGLFTGKHYSSEADGFTLHALLLTAKISGCQVTLTLNRDGEILKAKGNCDPMASVDSENNAG